MIVAEDLEADWAAVQIKHAPPDPVYGDQATGGSRSINLSYSALRVAGATARTMLIEAAAATWGVDAAACRAEKGAVIHDASGRSLPYGELVEAASQLPVPSEQDLVLKDVADFRIIGTHVADMNGPALVTGEGVFASDIQLPGMLVATVARPPTVGGRVSSFDPGPALAVDGVREVVEVSTGVAVVADTTWAAIRGRDALPVTWDDGDTSALNSDVIREDTTTRLAVTPDPGLVEAIYEIPFLAHASMEPMVCVADVREGSCEVWAPTQDRQAARLAAAKAAGLAHKAVTMHMPLMGGAFGRRLNTDYVTEAVEISKAVRAPVKTFWTREDDIQHDFYHPFNLGYRSAPPDAPGQPTGRKESDYSLPDGAWRSVDNFDEALANNCFIDELAAARGVDVLDLHRSLDDEQLLPVLEVAAEQAAWGASLPEGWGRGMAVHATFGMSPTAMVIEVSVLDGKLRVRRVVCVIDPGIVVDPSGLQAQLEGGIVFGLSAALHQEITVKAGRIEQSSFLDYPILRMDEMPSIEVHVASSGSEPGGAGEMGVPPTAPALLNAIFSATGRRIRHIPIRAEDLA
jgi:isoquinoline 1-oxidoreductase beta subunit